MKSTALGVKFLVTDLSVNYQLVGTSDNYSFQYDLGKGSSLVEEVYEEYTHRVDLKGNYGSFNVRVFAINDIGIRSQYIEQTISISAPEFKSTFSFNNLNSIVDLGTANNLIVSSPSDQDNSLIVNASFVGRSLLINWELIAPPGHSKEGQSLSKELLSDTFFDKFEITIKNGVDRILIDNDILNNSQGLQNYLLTDDVVGALSDYRNFSFEITTQAFNDLDLDRQFAIEIKSYDSYGRSSIATINCSNSEPEILNFTESLNSSLTSFSWINSDDDFSNVVVKYLYVKSNTILSDYTDLYKSVEYLSEIASAPDYVSLNNHLYLVGEKYLYSDGNVYQVIQEHTADINKNPSNTDFWENLGPKIEFFYTDENQVVDGSFSLSQAFGFDYYYVFCAYDEYGIGPTYNLTKQGIEVQGDDAILSPKNYELKVDNLSYRERQDTIVFNWDILDANDEVVDIEQLKINNSNASNDVLGIHAYLYDVNTQEPVYVITPGFNSKKLVNSVAGDSISDAGLISTKMFNEFEYTRELNNAIYGSSGYPANADYFDTGVIYTPANEDCALSSGDNSLHKSIINNSYIFPYVKIDYEEWDSNVTYSSGVDTVSYEGQIYVLSQDFGPQSDIVEGFYNNNDSYLSNKFVVAPVLNEVSLFDSAQGYNQGDYVYYNARLYLCLQDQAQGSSVIPSIANPLYWQPKSIGSDISFALYKSKNDVLAGSPLLPYQDTDNWEYQNPTNCPTHFSLLIPSYELDLNEWGTGINFLQGQYTVYKNDLWIATDSSGPDTDVGFLEPDQNSDYWTNTIDGDQDISTNHSLGDLVYHNNVVYKCLADSPTGGPLFADSLEKDSESSYIQSQWQPFWERNFDYIDIPLKHIAIPESGKRSIGLQVSLLDVNENILSSGRIDAENPAPYILYDDFNNTDGFVDSVSETTKVKFNFKYALDFQEKTTKVFLYRSSVQNFNITGSDGLPYSNLPSESNPDSTLAKIIIGQGDASFGENITFIEDSPPLAVVPNYEKYVNDNQDIFQQYIIEDPDQSKEDWGADHWLNQGQSEGYDLPKKNTTTGYYYKILPFDDFGSGVTHTVRESGRELINVFPKDFHNKNEYASNGPVVGAGLTLAEGAIPFAVRNLSGQTAFENFFLSWSTIDNDIDFFEVWSNKPGYSENESLALITGSGSFTGFLQQENNTGYRRTDGVIYSVGDVHPKEVVDQAWRIKNAERIFEVPASAKFIETVYPGSKDETRNFWIRAVDFAGNKGPFTGAALTEGDNISGLSLSLESISATDVSDFEISLTERFTNTIGLEPNNPFQNNSPSNGQISWDAHTLYFRGSEINISGNNNGLGDGYVWWQTGNEFYNTGIEHPANVQDGSFNDGDFIIARSRGGVATPTFNVFANALIGTANIAEAAVDSARIKDLTADKILAGTISGQDITLWSTYGEQGAIRTRGFYGVDHEYDRSGFLLSGDGTFAFQAGDSSLSLKNDTLTLVGNIRQSDVKDYDFIDINVVPGYFNYIEADDGFVLQDDSSVDIEVSFRNSRLVDLDQDKVYFKMESIVGGQSYKVFDYQELEFNQIISGFQYHTFTRKEDGSIVVNATLSGGFLDDEYGFHDIITNPVPGTTGDAVVLYVSGEYSAYEKSSTITRVIDGKIGIDGESAKTVKLEATDYSIVYDDKGLSPEFKSGPNSTQIQISAEASNFYSSPQYRFTKDGVVYSWGTTNIFNLGAPDSWSQGAFVIKVEVREGSSGGASASDSISIIRVKQGENALAGVLTNENHTISANKDGTYDDNQLELAGGEFHLFYGGERIEAGNITFGGNTSKNGLSILIDDGTYSLDGGLWSTNTETFDITAQYNGETITKRYSISKARQGIEGINAKSVRINAESLVFKKDKDNGSISPERIKLSAETQNTSSSSVTWSGSDEIYIDSSGQTKVDSPKVNVWVGHADLSTNVKVTITATIDGVSDSTTLILVEDGSNNVQAVLSNESHTLTESSDGSFDRSGSGTDIQVFDGSKPLTYTTGTLVEGKFTVNVSRTGGVTEGTAGSSGDKYTIGNLSAATGPGTLTFTITAKKGNGETVTITKVQSFAVSKFGEDGDPGPATPYRGDWLINKNKLSAGQEITYEKNDSRADIVFYDDGSSGNKYWMCNTTHDVSTDTSSFDKALWDTFGVTFSSVATDLLLSEDVVVTSTITVGSSDATPPSYFKFDADAGRLDMRGAVVNNTIAEDVGFNLSSLIIPGNIRMYPGEKIIYGAVGTTDFNEYLAGHYQVRLVQGGDQQVFTIESITNSTKLQVKEASLYTFGAATAYVETAVATFLGGGYNNEISPFPLAAGGYQSLASCVVGGAYNDITGRFSFIGNGFENACGDNFSAIVGGYQNKMPKVDSANQGANFIGAGQNNIIDGGTNQSILGGSDNQIINS